jgi:hypothetical protein
VSINIKSSCSVHNWKIKKKEVLKPGFFVTCIEVMAKAMRVKERIQQGEKYKKRKKR